MTSRQFVNFEDLVQTYHAPNEPGSGVITQNLRAADRINAVLSGVMREELILKMIMDANDSVQRADASLKLSSAQERALAPHLLRVMEIIMGKPVDLDA